MDLAILAPRQLAHASFDQFTYGPIDAPIVIELGPNYTDRHFIEDLEKLQNSKVDHAYLVHVSRVESAHNADVVAAIRERGEEARRDGIKIDYARNDLDRGKVFVKHLDDSTSTGPCLSLPEAVGAPVGARVASAEFADDGPGERILITVTQGGLDNSYVSLADT